MTGAAGTIGSELSRQLLMLNPKKHLLIDQNENGLYNLQQNIKNLNSKNVHIIYALCDCTNNYYVTEILLKNKEITLYFARARSSLT